MAAANHIKGQVSFVAGDETYILSFGINAIIAAEKATGSKFNRILKDISPPLGEDGVALESFDPPFELYLTLFWAALSDNHDLTIKEAGRLMQVTGMERAIELIAETLQNTFSEAAKGDSRPRKRPTRSGTG